MMTVRVPDTVRVATMWVVENQIVVRVSIGPEAKSDDMDDQAAAKAIHHVGDHAHVHTPGIDDEMDRRHKHNNTQ